MSKALSRPPAAAIKSIHLSNLLSFGAQSEPFELGSLNVLIGPNGSGKSNLIEAIGLLHGASRDLMAAIRAGGGVHEWLWKRAKDTPTASVDVVACPTQGYPLLRYFISFTEVGQRLMVVDERIESAGPIPRFAKANGPFLYFSYQDGQPIFNIKNRKVAFDRNLVDRQQSILSQIGATNLEEVTYLARLFASFRLYRDWSFGPRIPTRLPQPADLPNEFLAEDLSNLGLVLNQLRQSGSAKRALLENLRVCYQDAEDIDVSIRGGTVQVFVQERDYTVPATRLSDGTLRWLCLLVILLHPDPPPLVCIEEPELGLHPDMMPTLADLLREASERMQLIVTTHSDILVDALTRTPEAIVVCEKVEGATTLKRLSQEELSVWLEKYTLGQLWQSGQIGGNRW